jgi:PhnB protein
MPGNSEEGTTMSPELAQSGHPAITPYLAIKGADKGIEFYKQAFGAIEVMRLVDPDGRISHAEIRIGGSPVMISDEYPEIGVFSPQTLGGSPVMIILETADVDILFNQAVAAGAQVVRPLQDAFDGALRNAKLNDPFGHRWMILPRK